MDVNDNAGRLNERGVRAFFAGKPAPTGICVRFRFSPLIRPSVSSPSAFDLSAPSRGRVEVLRSGQPGMDAGLAAPGHGWPMAAGPRSRTGARAWRALARHRTKGARALGYLGLFQVTRRKGETNSRRHRRNGYVPPDPIPPSYRIHNIRFFLRRAHCRLTHHRQYIITKQYASAPNTSPTTTDPSKNGCHSVDSSPLIHSQVNSSGR